MFSTQMAMERVMSMDQIDNNKKTFATVHTQTDFGPYSAFPPQYANSGTRQRISQSFNNLFNFGRKTSNMEEESKNTHKAIIETSDHDQEPCAPLATPEMLNNSSPKSKVKKVPTRNDADVEMELISKR